VPLPCAAVQLLLLLLCVVCPMCLGRLITTTASVRCHTAYSYSPGNDNYNSFGAAMLAMYTLTTTENFPTVMCTWRLREWAFNPLGCAHPSLPYPTLSHQQLQIRHWTPDQCLQLSTLSRSCSSSCG